MKQLLAVFLLIFACAAFTPAPAHAYLLPLIGAGPAIIAMGIGILAALFSALYLVFFNIRRSIRKKMGKDSDDDEDEDAAQDKPHTPS